MLCNSFYFQVTVALEPSSSTSNILSSDGRSNIGTNILSIVIVPLHQGGNIELGLLDNLNLADVAVLNGEDGGGLTLNLLSGGSGNKSLDKGLEVTLSSEAGHGGNHLGTDLLHLGRLGVASLLELIILLLGEGNAEHADNVSVGGTAVNVGLDDGLLLLDEGAKLVTGHVHTVEVEETVVSLNILDTKLDLTVRHGLVVIEIGKGELDNTSLQSLRSNLGTLGLGDDGLSALLLGEDGRSDELVPLLLEEGVDDLLLSSLLGLRESLVLSLLMIELNKRERVR